MMITRKRGAQPGNTNALKHGIYATVTPQPASDEEKQKIQEGLDHEIFFSKALIQRLENLSHETNDLDEIIRITNASSVLLGKLCGALKTRQYLAKGRADSTELLSQAIEEVFGHGLDPRIP